MPVITYLLRPEFAVSLLGINWDLTLVLSVTPFYKEGEKHYSTIPLLTMLPLNTVLPLTWGLNEGT